MSLEGEIVQHEEYVESIVSGEFDLQEVVNKFRPVLSACQSAGLLKVLSDFRKLDGDIYVFEKIIYTLQAMGIIQDIFGPRHNDLQLAYVGTARQVSTYKPGLEIAKKVGIQAIVTDNMNEALEWLGVKKPNNSVNGGRVDSAGVLPTRRVR